MRCIAVINQEAGTGKTTVTANLGHALALAGHNVVVIDLDPRGCLAAALGLPKAPPTGIDEVLLGNLDPEKTIQSSRDRLDLVPAGKRLEEVERLEIGGPDKANLLVNALSGKLVDRDFILLDCPTSSGLIMANAIVAANEALVPMTGTHESIEALLRFTGLLAKFRPLRKRDLRNRIVRSRFFPRRRLTKEVSEKLLKDFPNQVLATVVSESAVLSESMETGSTIFEYRSSSQSARAFKSLALDLVENRTC